MRGIYSYEFDVEPSAIDANGHVRATHDGEGDYNVTEAEIRRIVQLKVEESIYDTFLWNVGSFEFHDGAASHQKSMLLSLDVTGIVLEGARRMDDVPW